MEDKIKSIIQKVRNMYKYDKAKDEILSKKAEIKFVEKSNGDIELSSITFADYDHIYVYSTRVVYNPYYGDAKVILKYRDWDELLNM